MPFPTYPATVLDEGVDLIIYSSNQFADIVNSDAETDIALADGSTAPSLRKALIESLYFNDPEDWNEGSAETVFNNVRSFTDAEGTSFWYAPSARSDNPVTMGVSPDGDPNWHLYPYHIGEILTENFEKITGLNFYPRNTYTNAAIGSTISASHPASIIRLEGDYYRIKDTSTGATSQVSGLIDSYDLVAGTLSIDSIIYDIFVFSVDAGLRGDLQEGTAQIGVVTAQNVSDTVTGKTEEITGMQTDGLTGDHVTVGSDVRLGTQQILTADGLFVLDRAVETSGAVSALDTDAGTLTIGSDDYQIYVPTVHYIEATDLIGSMSFRVGSRVHAKRYYVGGDLVSGLEYIVLPASTGTPDGYIDHADASGNYLQLVHNGTITLEQAGAIADCDPETLTGTPINPMYNAIADKALDVKLRGNSNYLTTGRMYIYSGMHWEGDFTCHIYSNFATPGYRIFEPVVGETYNDVSIKGVSIHRSGPNPDHGIIIAGATRVRLDVAVYSDDEAAGGAVGISPFLPWAQPSTDVEARVEAHNGGNFACQLGNVRWGRVHVDNHGTFREAIGCEPFCLGAVTLESGDVTDGGLFYYPDHGMETGHPMFYSNEGNPDIVGIEQNEFYFAIRIDDDHVRLADSELNAWRNIALTVSETVSGSHLLYKAGFQENITVSMNSHVGSVAANGSSTGVVIATITSGGWLSNVRLSNIRSTLNNPATGTHNVHVFGARNLTITDCDLNGAEQETVLISRGFINGTRDENGNNIDPSNNWYHTPEVTLDTNNIRNAKSFCVRVADGRAIVRNNQIGSTSTSPAVVGLSIEPEAEALGSYHEGNVYDMPYGIPYYYAKGRNNKVIGRESITDIDDDHSCNHYNKFIFNPNLDSNIVCHLINTRGISGTPYSGLVNITAKYADANNTETATYLLHVGKGATSLAAQLTTLNQLGLVSGYGVTHPSFTFTINPDNQLVATPVGSTDPNHDWVLWINTTGDIVTEDAE